MKIVDVRVATKEDLHYVNDVELALQDAANGKGNGIAVRTAAYLSSKINEGKAVIATDQEGKWAGFCYIESWGHNKFVANSGLIVSPDYRGMGLAGRIKLEALKLSEKLFPGAKLFGLTTSLAVMKINSDLGYRPVTFSELTTDEEFWKGCQSCPYYDILVRTQRKHCLCTGMLMDPAAVQKKEQGQGVQATALSA